MAHSRPGRLPRGPRSLLRPTLFQAALTVAFTALIAPQALAQSSDPGARPATPLRQIDVEAQRDATAEPGSNVVIEREQLERARSFADVIRQQPLVAAPGTVSGASRGRSSFDRGGTTGYNIRGIDGNRIGLSVDGVELPEATTRPYGARTGVGTFGVGRDFLDPEMYSQVEIDSGTTGVRRPTGGIGGAVEFRTKSPRDYLDATTTRHLEGKLGYDSADRSWNESITAAGQAGDFQGLVAYSRRDGDAKRNHSDTLSPSPDDWHSNALLLKGIVGLDATQSLQASLDSYRRTNRPRFNTYTTSRNAPDTPVISERVVQVNDTARDTLRLAHAWTPNHAALDRVQTTLSLQRSESDDRSDSTSASTGVLQRNVNGRETRQWSANTVADKRLGAHHLQAGLNASVEERERHWKVVQTLEVIQPEPDSRTRRAGLFVQDEINLQAGGRRLAVTPGIRVDRVDTAARHFSGFAKGALSSADAERLYGGDNAHTFVNPSLAAVYEVAPLLNVYAQYRRGGRAPSAGELFGTWNLNQTYAGQNQYTLVGNRDLKPERSNAFELGVKGSPMPGVAVSAAIFDTRYEDFIASTRYLRNLHPSRFTRMPSHIGIIYEAENRDSARIYGTELSARIEHGRWSPALAGVYSTWALGLSKGTAKSRYPGDKDLSLNTILPRKAIVGLGYDAPERSWGISLLGTFTAGKRAVADTRGAYANQGAALADSSTLLFRAPGRAVFDLATYYQLGKHLRLDAGIYNLTGKRYWDYSSVQSLQPAQALDRRDIELLSEPGRTVAVSLNARF